MIERKAIELTELNVDFTCTGFCEDCEKFFDCELPAKKSGLMRQKMDIIEKCLRKIKYKLVVVGGKGGVGKSVMATNIATGLAMKGRKISVLDQCFDGPAIPRMFGAEGKTMQMGDDGMIPVKALQDTGMDIDIVSMGNVVLEDEPLSWFHAMRRNATEEFLGHVNYGERDYLIVDVPPGTSSDTTNLLQCVPDLAGAVVICLPSDIATSDSRRAGMLCKKAGVPLLGIIENMSGVRCPHCGEKEEVLQTGGGEGLAKDLDTPLLAKIMMDHDICLSTDTGVPFIYGQPDIEVSKLMRGVVDEIEKQVWK